MLAMVSFVVRKRQFFSGTPGGVHSRVAAKAAHILQGDDHHIRGAAPHRFYNFAAGGALVAAVAQLSPVKPA